MRWYVAEADSGTAALEPLAGLAGLAALLAGWYLPLDRLGLMVCPLRGATGLPCFLCGGTRSFVAASRLDLAGAWTLNPLVSLLPLVLMVMVPYALLAFLFSWPRLRLRLDRRWEPYLLRSLIVSAVGIQWFYLLLR